MTHASLFSGIGGFDLAAEWIGWENLFYCEINEFSRKILNYHFPKSIAYEDIRKTNFTKWRGTVDVISGGFPCQPFSLAGQRKGADDDRYLWPEMLRAIREIQPAWVVGENVAGILTMVQPGKETSVGSEQSIFGEDYRERILIEQEYVVETVCRNLEREGYSVQPFVIPACAVGAPHRRDRVWFVANCTDTRIESLQQTRENRIYKNGFASDTYCNRLQKFCISNCNEKEKRETKRRCFEEYTGNDWKSLYTERWKDFPTVSPVCGRNDGLPFNVDDLTIPFTRWRQESIKAYGNAIVPQIAYEIFKSIENFE